MGRALGRRAYRSRGSSMQNERQLRSLSDFGRKSQDASARSSTQRIGRRSTIFPQGMRAGRERTTMEKERRAGKVGFGRVAARGSSEALPDGTGITLEPSTVGASVLSVIAKEIEPMPYLQVVDDVSVIFTGGLGCIGMHCYERRAAFVVGAPGCDGLISSTCRHRQLHGDVVAPPSLGRAQHASRVLQPGRYAHRHHRRLQVPDGESTRLLSDGRGKAPDDNSSSFFSP